MTSLEVGAMVTAVQAPPQLADPDSWPLGATVYDRDAGRFLTRDEARELGKGITKQRLHALVFRPLVEVVPDTLFEGYNVLSAPPKIGKTVIMHQLLISVDMGQDWLGRPCRQGPVLFIGLEDTLQSVKSRDERLAPDLDTYITGGAGRLVITDPDESPHQRIDQLSRILHEGYEGRPYALVVVDTSPRFLGNGDPTLNAYERGLALTAPLDRLGLLHHVAVVGIHHDRKASDGDDFDAVSGGLSITGTAQCVMSLRRTRGGKSGTLAVYPRAAEERRYALDFLDGAWALSPETRTEVALLMEGCRKDILAWLWQHAQDGAPLADIITALPRHSYGNVTQALQRLRRDGLVAIDGATWTPLPDPRSVPRPAPTPAPPVQRWLPTDAPCERCGATPARLCNRSGSKWCASCSPALWAGAPPAGFTADQRAPGSIPHPPQGAGSPAAPQSPPPAAVDVAPPAYQRPPWAPATLGEAGHGPITVWNRLMEESFRLARVQLIMHPYPKGEVPAPWLNRGQRRGMMIHEGHHRWRNPEIPTGAELTRIDRNGGFLGALGSAQLPIGRTRHVDGRGDRKHAGAHRLDRWPQWTHPTLPHPAGREPDEPEIWVCTRQLDLMERHAEHLELFQVLESWTGPTLRLERLQAVLRDARTAAIDAGDDEFVDWLKAVYSIGLATTGESGHNTRIWRPDWNSAVRANHHANHWISAEKVHRAPGITLAYVGNTDELHTLGDPFGSCQYRNCLAHPPQWTGTGPLLHSRSLAGWKYKVDPPTPPDQGVSL